MSRDSSSLSTRLGEGARRLSLLTPLPAVLLGLTLAGLLPSQQASAQAVLCKDEFNQDRGNLRYCNNHKLGTVNEAVTRAVIVIHGAGQDATRYFSHVSKDAVAEGVESTTTIIAPQFIGKAEVDRWGLGAAYERWSSEGWKEGDDALTGGKHSSYAWVDAIVDQLLADSPNLEHITILGFSAGGQFANRYSASTGAVETAAARGVTMSFVIGSASNYLWTNSERPEGTEGCSSTYNDYRYGLENRASVPYVAGLSEQQLVDRLYWRNIYYFVGGDDTEIGEVFDESCEANAQGANRLTRAENYHAHLQSAFEFDYPFHVVPDVDHSASASFDDPTIRNWVFHATGY